MLCDLSFLPHFGMIIGAAIISDLVMWITEEGKFFNFFPHKLSTLSSLPTCRGPLYTPDCSIYLLQSLSLCLLLHGIHG